MRAARALAGAVPMERAGRAKPVDPRKRPSQARAQLTVDAILVATERVLAQRGTTRATTNRIAEVAGVSIGSLYQYFPNKEALIESVRQRQSERFRDRVEPEVAVLLGLPLRDAVRRLVELMLRIHADGLHLHNALAEGDPHLPEELHERWIPLMVAYLEARREEIRPVNLELAARIAIEALEALTHGVALRSPEMLADEEYTEELTQLLLRYLER
jgi:AcrR family transcriptional regulator